MNFHTHNDAEINTDGLSWTFSTIQATRAEMIAAFGEPMDLSASGKVNFQWALSFQDGTLATIYDWKKPEVDERTPLTWNIGADHTVQAGRVVSLVHNAFREAHGMTARSAA